MFRKSPPGGSAPPPRIAWTSCAYPASIDCIARTCDSNSTSWYGWKRHRASTLPAGAVDGGSIIATPLKSRG